MKLRPKQRHEQRMIVIGVLVKAREEWERMDERDRKALARHVLAIGKHLDESASSGRRP